MTEFQTPIQRPAEDRMDMRSLVEVLIRRRWVVVGVALPVIVVALVGTLRSAQLFMARTTLMVEMSSPQTPAFNRTSVNYDMVLSSAAEIAMSAPVAAEAALALADSLPILQRELPKYFEGIEGVAGLQDAILGGVNCSHVGESNLLNLSYTHPNARFALMGAGALARAFIEFNISTKHKSSAVEYFTEQMGITQAEIDVLMERRTAVLNSSGLMGMQADLKLSFQQIRGLESEYFKAQSRRRGLKVRLEGMRAASAASTSGTNIRLNPCSLAAAAIGNIPFE